MAKIYGLFGAMSGKVADVVMSVRNGEQIVRKYQPIVRNPQTENQYTTRARFKLLSQMSAVMAPYIAIRREGAVSPRNIFTRINFGSTTFENNQADIALSGVKLTTGVVSLPAFVATRGDSGVTVALTEAARDLNRVAYVAFVRMSDGTLRALTSVVASESSANYTFPATLSTSQLANDELYIYAYGVRINTDTANRRFGNMTIDGAEDIAKLIVSSMLLETDVTVTETKYFNLPVQG